MAQIRIYTENVELTFTTTSSASGRITAAQANITYDPISGRLTAAQGDIVYTPVFAATHRDYWEWTENFMNTFLTRLQAALKGDTTIAAYNSTRVAIVATGDLTRYQINAMLAAAPTLIVIHTPRERIDREMGGSGREDVVMECTITTAVRTGKAFNDTTDREVALTGDSTALQPGVLEMQADIASLLHNNGAMNLLTSGGQPYLWNLEWGEVEVEASAEKKSEILMAHRKVTGHKWMQNWS
jgi:hypothetical protein